MTDLRLCYQALKMRIMNPVRWQKIKGLFDTALELDPSERSKFIEKSCPNDNELREEVKKLLDSFDESESFIEHHATEKFASLIIESKKLEAGKRFGHYEIVKQIGEGGMGEVYLANDKKLGRQVAIKILNPEIAKHESNLNRFMQEAKAVSALNHPNILVIHDIGEVDDLHFIVSELVEGKTLREILKQSVLTVSEILDFSIQIAIALTAAHAARIVHRDVKPENIIVRSDGLVKILDFGLAKLIEQKTIGAENSTLKQNQTAKGLILGTINYMSPEQAKGSKVDERMDVFSFGVVLYEMITGRVPFAGDSVSETFANLMNVEPQPLARFSLNVPDELQRVVSKTLRKNKDDRYQTMKGLLADLKGLKENMAFEAKTHSSPSLFKQNSGSETAIITAPSTEIETAQPQGVVSRRNLVFAAVFAILVIGALGYFWYGRQTAVASHPEIKSLAVLPLKSLDSGENYLGLGIADAIIRKINQTGEIIVRPTSAVRRYLDEDTDALVAAKQLNTDAVLEGNVQRSDDRLRVSINLLRTSDGASLWADSFDMNMTDIFTIQDTVALQVATRLQLQLDPSEQAQLMKRNTSNPIAYEFYVKGIYNLDQRGDGEAAKPQMEETVDFFKKALEVDPNYALAHAQLAYAYTWTALFIEPTEPKWSQFAKDEIKRSQEMDPQLAESHVANALLLWSAYEGFKMEAAVRELLLAQQLNANTGHADLAVIYGHMGLEDPAAHELQRALNIDPTSQNVNVTLVLYFLAGRTDEYLASYQKLNLGKPVPTWCLMRKGQLEDAQTRIDSSLKKYPNEPGLLLQKSLLLALKENFSSAEAAIPGIVAKLESNDPNRHHNTYDIACVYALAGKSGEAVKWLKETAETGFPNYPLFERDPYLNRIRQAPEFIQFMADMKSLNEKYRNEFK